MPLGAASWNHCFVNVFISLDSLAFSFGSLDPSRDFIFSLIVLLTVTMLSAVGC